MKAPRTHIKHLIQRYWNGWYSTEEADQIRSAFKDQTVRSWIEEESDLLYRQTGHIPIEPQGKYYREAQGLLRRLRRKEKREPLVILKPFQVAAAIAAFILSMVLTFYTGRRTEQSLMAKEGLEEQITTHGSKSKVLLPDGSTVWINAGSVLIYPKEFRGNTRSVYLSGEAHFTVTPHPGHPFIVKTKHTETTALGTVFNVEAYPTSNLTSTTLEEGSVEVGFNTVRLEPKRLKPNQRIVFDHLTRKVRLSWVDAKQYSSWIEGYLVFKDEPFERIVAGIERKYNVSINYPAGKYDGKQYFMRFAPNDPIEHVMIVFSTIADNFSYTLHETEISIK